MYLRYKRIIKQVFFLNQVIQNIKVVLIHDFCLPIDNIEAVEDAADFQVIQVQSQYEADEESQDTDNVATVAPRIQPERELVSQLVRFVAIDFAHYFQRESRYISRHVIFIPDRRAGQFD